MLTFFHLRTWGYNSSLLWLQTSRTSLSETRNTSKLTFQIHIIRLQKSFQSQSGLYWSGASIAVALMPVQCQSLILHSAHFIRAFSATLSEALRRSVSECAMRQHAPHLCDGCMKQWAVRHSLQTSNTLIYTSHRRHVPSIQNKGHKEKCKRP